MGSKFLGPQP